MIKKKKKVHKKRMFLKNKKKNKLEKEESHKNENEDSPRSDTKTPSRWVQKNHPKSQIIGDKDLVVKTEENYCMMKNKHYFR